MVVVQIAAAHDLASFEQPVGRDAGLRPGTGLPPPIGSHHTAHHCAMDLRPR
jgi:hypothetical protein